MLARRIGLEPTEFMGGMDGGIFLPINLFNQTRKILKVTT